MATREQVIRLLKVKPMLLDWLEAEETDKALPPYAWPGGYALIYVDREGETYCSKCATESLREALATSPEAEPYYFTYPYRIPVDCFTDEEHEEPYSLSCANCGQEIAPPSEWALEEEAKKQGIPGHELVKTGIEAQGKLFAMGIACSCGQWLASPWHTSEYAYAHALEEAIAHWQRHLAEAQGEEAN